MGNPAQPQGPSRLDTVTDLLSKKMLELSAVMAAPNVDDPTYNAASDELDLCTPWMAALTPPGGGAGLPPVPADQPLLDAIAQVGQLIATNAAANQLASATATLISAYKAPPSG